MAIRPDVRPIYKTNRGKNRDGARYTDGRRATGGERWWIALHRLEHRSNVTLKVAAVAIGVSEANLKPLLLIHRLSFYPSCSRPDLNLKKFEIKNYIILFISLKIWIAVATRPNCSRNPSYLKRWSTWKFGSHSDITWNSGQLPATWKNVAY